MILKLPSHKCLVVVLLFSLFNLIVSVKHEIFKTCSQSGFCKRNRQLADHATSQGINWQAPYHINQKSLKWKNSQLIGNIMKKSETSEQDVLLPFIISFLESGTARVSIDEERRQKSDVTLRHNSKARKERYNEAAAWTIVGGLNLSKTAKEKRTSEKSIVTYGPTNQFEAEVTFSPFSIEFKRDGVTEIKLNDRGLINIEDWRTKYDASEQKEGKESNDVQANRDQSTSWEESFGGNTDTKPRGPESVALDITFPNYEHVFGIPEHASSLSLKETRGGSGNYKEPYRLYNADVFEYIMDSPMTLYGAIPFMQAHREHSTVGIFWLNAAETWVDIIKEKKTT